MNFSWGIHLGFLHLLIGLRREEFPWLHWRCSLLQSLEPSIGSLRNEGFGGVKGGPGPNHTPLTWHHKTGNFNHIVEGQRLVLLMLLLKKGISVHQGAS